MNLRGIYFLNEIGEKKNQEDSIWPLPGTATLEDRIFIVCDGVGGLEKGEVASRVVAEFVGSTIQKNKHLQFSVGTLNNILREAKQELLEYALTNKLNTEMATTFSMVVFEREKAFLAWCGDSRIYHIRNGEVKYKTEDHSLVNSLIQSGQISEDEALLHPQKNVILRAVKADDTPVEADGHWVNNIQDGDYFLLCTDGLLENIGDKELKDLLTTKSKRHLVESFQSLCLNKTKDNYSMYLLEIGKRSSKKSFWILLGITTLLLIGIFVVAPRFMRHYVDDINKKAIPIMQNEHSNDSVASQNEKPTKDSATKKNDSLPYEEIVKTPKNLGLDSAKKRKLTNDSLSVK